MSWVAWQADDEDERQWNQGVNRLDPVEPAVFSPVMPRFMTSRLFAVALAGLTVFTSACSSTYYNTLEKFGYAKRDLLVERVEKAQGAQTEAKEQFASALEHFLAVTKVDGGDLQKKYAEMSAEFKRSEDRAKEVNDRIAAVEDVAVALFREWKQELNQYSNASLRTQSERQLEQTQRHYDTVIRLMHRSAERMDPVLSTFRDQVLFMKHNLNARALASLTSTNRALEEDIARLIGDMEVSIREAETFIKTLQTGN